MLLFRVTVIEGRLLSTMKFKFSFRSLPGIQLHAVVHFIFAGPGEAQALVKINRPVPFKNLKPQGHASLPGFDYESGEQLGADSAALMFRQQRNIYKMKFLRSAKYDHAADGLLVTEHNLVLASGVGGFIPAGMRHNMR